MRLICKFFVLMLFIFSNNYCQSLSISLSSGISKLQGDDYYSREMGPEGYWVANGVLGTMYHGLDFRTEYNFALGLKYAVKDLPFSLIGRIHYIPMRGSKESEVYNSVLMQIIPAHITTKLDIWSLSLGGRYNIELCSLKPFLSASFLINYFEDTKIQNDYDTPNEHPFTTIYTDHKNGMRYGYYLGFGAGYSFTTKIGLELEAGYNVMNELNRRGPIPEGYKFYPAAEDRLDNLNFLLNFNYRIF